MIYIKSNEHNIINNYNDKVKMILRPNLKSVTYNLHGFSQGKSYCNDYDIIFMREHWLAPVDLDALNSTYVQ